MTTAAPSPPAVHADRPLLGVLLMVVFCVLAPIGDATAKLLGVLPLAQILLVRYAMQARSCSCPSSTRPAATSASARGSGA